jgi:hypothetical protein
MLCIKIKLKDGICQNCYYAMPHVNWIVEEDWHFSQNNASDTADCFIACLLK